MNNLTNPADQEMPKFLADLKKNVDDVSKVNQFYRGDWLEVFDEIEVTETTPRVMAFTEDIDPRDVFVLGDPVRWKEDGGSFQYGYIFEITEDDFTVINDNFSTSGSAEISEFSRGIVRRPLGHPVIFHNQCTDANEDFEVASGSVTGGAVGIDWWMEGAVLNLIGSTLGMENDPVTTSSASTFGLNMIMPFLQLRNDPVVVGYVNISTSKPCVIKQGLEAIGTCHFTTFVNSGIFTLGVVFNRNNFSNWGSDTYDLEFDLRGVPYDLG